MTAISLAPLVEDTVFAHHFTRGATVHKVVDCGPRVDIAVTPIAADDARTLGVNWCRLATCWPGNRCAHSDCREPSGDRDLCGACERAEIGADVRYERAIEHDGFGQVAA